MTESDTWWVAVGIVLTTFGIAGQWWLRARAVIQAKNGTIQSLRNIIGMQAQTLNDLIHHGRVQHTDQRGTRVTVELDAPIWNAIHHSAALSAILLMNSTADKGEQTDGP